VDGRVWLTWSAQSADAFLTISAYFVFDLGRAVAQAVSRRLPGLDPNPNGI
jgi:hypothetical protein